MKVMIIACLLMAGISGYVGFTYGDGVCCFGSGVTLAWGLAGVMLYKILGK